MRFGDSIPAWFLALVAAGACGGGDGGGSPTAPPPESPSDDLTPVVGTWSADSIFVSPKANPEVFREIVGEDGAQFTFVVQSSGAYSASLRAFGAEGHEVGTLRLSGNLILFTVQSPSPGNASGRWSRRGDDLILESDLTLDFNRDGTPDDLDTRFVLSR